MLSPCPVVSSRALHQSFQILKEKRRKGAGEEPACGHCSALAEAPRPTHKPDGCDPKVLHQEMQNLKPRRNDQSTSPAGSHGAAKRPKPPSIPPAPGDPPQPAPHHSTRKPKGEPQIPQGTLFPLPAVPGGTGQAGATAPSPQSCPAPGSASPVRSWRHRSQLITLF